MDQVVEIMLTGAMYIAFLWWVIRLPMKAATPPKTEK